MKLASPLSRERDGGIVIFEGVTSEAFMSTSICKSFCGPTNINEPEPFAVPKKVWLSLIVVLSKSNCFDSVSTKIKLGIEKGDVEYFSINGNQFRFQKSAQKNNLYDIQLKTDNGWITKLSLPMPKETFFLTHDFDLDNNFDLSYLEYGNINIHFFDKTSQRFILKPMQFSYDCALLDSSNLIYGVNNHGSSEWNIDIFSIKDRTKTYLYKSKLFLKNNSNNGGFEVGFEIKIPFLCKRSFDSLGRQKTCDE